ncbi:Protein of unknown function (DUF3198) [Aciduliprofundum sp. MAR08-339]|nr:Protein of unknown function (DUF3198) [Aciduliprofundum sp. MAR08-339]
MSWSKLREYILHISLALFVIGIYLLITSGYWVLASTKFIQKDPGMDYLTAWAGNWNYWLLVLGIIFVIAGGWFTFDTLRKRLKFEEYIDSESKREFVNNLRELEEISYKLGKKYQERLEETKRKWRVK